MIKIQILAWCLSNYHTFIAPVLSFPRRRESSITIPPGFRIKYGMTDIVKVLMGHHAGKRYDLEERPARFGEAFEHLDFFDICGAAATFRMSFYESEDFDIGIYLLWRG